MTFTYELDIDRVTTNRCAKYLGQRSFRSKVIMRTQTHTASQLHYTAAEAVVNNPTTVYVECYL